MSGRQEVPEQPDTLRPLRAYRQPGPSLLARLEALRTRARQATEPMGKRPLAGELASGAVLQGLSRLLGSDPDMRLGHDPEGVHRGRVATRRLRAHLRTFAQVLGEEPAGALRSELGWLGDKLGAVRDIDVLADLLAGAAARLGDERAGLAVLFGDLSDARRRSFAELTETLSSERYLALLASTIELASSPLGSELVTTAASEVAGSLVAPSWRRLQARVAELGERPSDRALHKVRIRAKELRYACEAVGPVSPPEAGELARLAKELQSVLGKHQDGVVFQAYLREEANRSPAHGYAAGLCLAPVLSEPPSLAWGDLLEELQDRRLRKWFA